MFKPSEKVIARNEIAKALNNEKGVLVKIFRKHLEKLLLDLLEQIFPEVWKRIFKDGDSDIQKRID